MVYHYLLSSPLHQITLFTEFYTNENAHVVENYLRFSVTRTNEALEQAKERLRALKKYM
jgi:kynurenine aminotransferase